MKQYGKIPYIVRDMWKRYIEHDIPGAGAQMAYFLLLSIFPFLMFLIAVLGYLSIPVDDAIAILSVVVPNEVVGIIGKYIEHLLVDKNGNLLFISLTAAFWTSSNALNVLMNASNRAYKISETRGFVRKKLLAIPFMILVTLCVAAGLMIPILSKDFLTWLSQYISMSARLIDYLRYLKWLIAIFTVFNVIAIIYFLAPDKKLTFKEIVPGTLIGALGWILISAGFSIYVNKVPNYSVIYGSIGAVIILIIWLFWGALTIVMGAELNASIKEWKRINAAREKSKGSIKADKGSKYTKQPLKLSK